MEKSLKSIATNYGLYLGLLSIIMLIIMYVFNMEKNWGISSISFVFTVLIFVMGIKSLKSSNNNFLKLGEAIKVGLGIAAVGGLVSAIYTFIHYSYIQPEFVENIRQQSLEKMIEQSPNLTNEQMETATKMTNVFTSPFAMSTFTLIGTLLLGIVISLISGLIMKKGETNT